MYEALRSRPDIKPDLIVGHSGFGSTLFLPELYDCPIINYFEYFYRTTGTDMDFRPDFPSTELNRLRAHARNAMLLLDLEQCRLGYSPTRWQRSKLPELFHDKVRVVFDGIDTEFWQPVQGGPRTVAGETVPEDMRVITYVSRGMESMRGFDIFMKAAKKICDRRDDVIFLIAGEDRICYGGDERVIGHKSFKKWALSQEDYDLSRIRFLGRVQPRELVNLFALSDLHVYLTVPFVLSWSLMDALACGATVLASDTGPVREVIEHEQNGLLVDFFDADRMADIADEVLDSPGDFQHLGAAGVELIREKYSLEVCLPQMESLYEEAIQGQSSQPAGIAAV